MRAIWGRHGSKRVSKAVLIGAVKPIMLKTGKNPEGIPLSVFDEIRAGVAADRSQFFRELTTPFYGYNKPDAKLDPMSALRHSPKPISPKISRKLMCRR